MTDQACVNFEQIDRIQQEVLTNLCSLLQLNNYMFNFGENIKKLTQESLSENIEFISKGLNSPSVMDKTEQYQLSMELIEHNERIKKTLTLLTEDEEC